MGNAFSECSKSDHIATAFMTVAENNGAAQTVNVGNRDSALQPVHGNDKQTEVRNTAKYSNLGKDRIRKRFTGYEKDDETGLDFAEARMYQNRHGRFTAPDPLLASASAVNPQTFNRYTYTGNDPVNLTDPSGLQNADKTVKFIANTPCTKDQTDITGRTLMQSGYDGGVDSNGNPINRGDYTTFYEDGRALVETQAAYAARTGAEVRGGSEAPLLPTEVGGLGGTFFPKDLIPLPCPSFATCGPYTAPYVDLTEGASFDDMLDAAEIGAALAGEIPVVGEPIDLFIGGGISLFRGDREGAILSALSAIPGPVGNAAGITKLARKASDAVEVASDIRRKAPSLPDKTIVKQDGVTIDHNYKSNDHSPAPAHVTGGGPDTRIGANGKPLKGDAELSTRQRSVVTQNKSRIRRDINKIRRWLRREKWGK